MSTLERVASATGPTRGAIVFAHGLGGDAHGTWQRDDRPDTFWPAWLGQDLPDLDVWTLSYDASPSTWLGHAMELPDRAGNVLAALEAERLEGTPLVFVCHSLGGLVVKQLLRASYDRPNQRIGQFLHRTQGVAFLATPNTGSDLATWADRFRVLVGASAATQDLRPDTAALRDLNAWYRDHAPQEDIATLVFFETRATKGVRVVDPSSADPGIPHVTPIAYDADHIGIVKPASRDDMLYKQVLRFVEDRLPHPKAPARSPRGPRRIFISYRRRAETDARLAKWLHGELTGTGHDVFIDTGMKVGVDWSQEIDRRIAWCEFLIVLLSEDSIASEMVQQEVQQAAQRRRSDGTPWLLPVRVAYDGPLGYALGAALDRYQYARWSGSADDRPVLDALLAAIGQTEEGRPLPLGAPDDDIPRPLDAIVRPTVVDRPAPAADPRVLKRPGGGMKLDDPCYIERPADALVRSLAHEIGETLVIKASRQMGKTSLLVRYLADCRKAGKKVALIDCQQISDGELDHQKTAMTRIAARLIRELEIDPSARQPIDTPGDLTDFIEDVIFPKIEQPIVVAFDEVDSLIPRPYRNSLFAALRSWHNNRATRPDTAWERLDLALVVATEPSMFIQDVAQSPFNVTEPVRLEPLRRPALERLDGLFGHRLKTSELDSLHDLTGGQPYLVRSAFWCMASGEGMSFGDLDRHAAADDGPFGEHLRAKLNQLQQRPELLQAYGDLILRGTQPAQDKYWRLQAAGLVRRPDDRTIAPFNLLYARFFQRMLR